jgi:hypothetical protein
VSLDGTLFVDKKVSMESRDTHVPNGLVKTDRFFAYTLSTEEMDFWSHGSGLAIPYWLILACTTTLAALPWLRWSKRFSMRTLLIALTAVAVVLGLIVWSIR